MNRFLILTVYLAFAAETFGALSVPASLTTGVQTFSTTPAATEWSTLSIAGASGTLASTTAVDNAAQALTAAEISTALGTQTGNPTNAIAQHNSTANFIYTAPTGNNATALMATLQNDSGSTLGLITIAYDHTRISTAAEEAMGHRVFYSLTGLANSWTLIPDLSGIGTNQSLSATVTLTSSWANSTKLYLLWMDDNGSGTDTPFTIDNFVVTASSDVPPWPYTQNFNGMNSGTVAPAGWSFYGVFGGGNATFTDSIPITNASVAGGTLNNTLTATTTFTTSSNTTGFNFALPASTSDRALGTSPTTGQFVALQLSLTNPTGAPLNALRIGYDIRRFTTPPTANELPGYWLFYSLNNGTTWTNVSTLNPTLANVPNTIGVTTVPPTTFTLNGPWNAGSTILFRWIDDNAAATSPDQIHGLDNVSITVPIGQPPVATLTAPTNGSVFSVGDTINLTATASDPDGTIVKAEFYQDGTKLGEDTTEPYEYAWTGFTANNYNLTVRATDNDGNVTASNAAGITVNAAPGSGTLTRSPYLNSANHNSIVVRWRTSQAVVGRVRYGTSTGSLTQTTDETVARTDHQVKLTGLSPYTRYYYSVGSAYDTLTPEMTETTSFSPGAPAPTAADYTFRTSPTPGTAVDTRIWIVGDCGRGTQTQASGRDAYYAPNFTGGFTGSRIPDLNLQMGDNAYNSGTDAEYQTGYFKMYANIFRKMPQWSTLGNHDANGGSTDPLANFPYFDMFTFPTAGECGGVASGTEHYYSFDYGNIHFICLDSQASVTTVDNPSTPANEDGPMATWLRQDLANTTSTWIIAFWHHPPYSKGSHDSDTDSQMTNMRNRFNPILENGGVDLVFLGHSHNYERSVLLDGHYGVSSTITTAMKKNSGNGSTTGFTTTSNGKIRNAANGFTATATTPGAVIPADGAYIKPLTGPRDHFGTVYNTAGMSGLADSSNIDHSAMYISYNNVGTVNLDVNGNSLTCTFVQSGGATPDNFTITKQGAADTDGDGISDAYEIAYGLNRYSNDALSSADTDGLVNLLEFAFGLNPNLNDNGVVEANIPGALLTKRGTPTNWFQTTTNGTDFKVIYIRRKDAAEAGLVYSPQFSGDMTHWVTSTATPTVIADGGDVEVVSITYPLFVAGKEARFFRIGVNTTH